MPHSALFEQQCSIIRVCYTRNILSFRDCLMPTKDIHHDAVKNALIADGWTITHDPLTIKFGQSNLFVDLGAERLLAAEKAQVKIAVEV